MLHMTRCRGKAQNEQCFANAICLYPTRDQVNEVNKVKLIELQKPYALISSKHVPPSAKNASAEDAGGIRSNIVLGIGSRVMLTTNLWIDAGLVNGSIGEIVDIVYAEGTPPQLPTFVIVQFRDYTGPSFLQNVQRAVPILPVCRNWCQGGRQMFRTGLPLTLAWAVTIHKSQGLTLDKTDINIGAKEYNAGQSFVALSRVRSLDSLLISPFSFDRLSSAGVGLRMQERKLEDRRIDSMSIGEVTML